MPNLLYENMGTKGLYHFRDEGKSSDLIFTIYAQWDSYPNGAALVLGNTIKSGKVWELPRFEADEFAAGFLAANKELPGAYRMTAMGQNIGGIDYEYSIWQNADSRELMVKIKSNYGKWDGKTWNLNKFITFHEWLRTRDDYDDYDVDEQEALFILEMA